MTERENALLVYHHQKPEWTPISIHAIHTTGLWGGNECGLRGEIVAENVALDVFGVKWEIGHGAPVPVPGEYLLEDITEWRNLTFPEPKTWNWEELAKKELENYDGTKVLLYFCEQGCFDRLTQLMGFENALMALLLEPEECQAFFERMVQYKIEIIECVAKYYHPDVFMYTDDLAKSDSLFMSPDTYRELIKPYHAQIIKAIKDNGMIPEQHTCGKCEAIIDDFVEIGIESFFPAQPSNDLVAIQKKYGDRLVLKGGFNSQGPAGYDDASEETMRAEGKRTAMTYAVNGGYIFYPLIGSSPSAPSLREKERTAALYDEFRKQCTVLGV